MVPTGIKLLAIGALQTACEEVEGRALSAELIIQNTTKYKIKQWNIEEMVDLIRELLVFRIRPPTTLCFLEIYARACGVYKFEKIFNFAQFLCDLAIIVHQNSIFLPSTIAVCCMRFALRRLAPYYAEKKINIAPIAGKIERLMMHSSKEKEVDVCARELFLNLNRFWLDPK